MIWQCSHCGGFTLDRKYVRVPLLSWMLAWGLAGLGISFLITLLVSTVVHGAEPDLPLLRDTICGYETRGEETPSAALNHNRGKRVNKYDRGDCQVGEDTAWDLTEFAVASGRVPIYMLMVKRAKDKAAFNALLHHPPVNLGYALAYLERSVYEWHRRTCFSVAFSYNRGRRPRTRDDPGWGYAETICEQYERAKHTLARN